METSPQALHQIMYLSSATQDWSDTELLELLDGSRKRNAKRGVTGLLLYADGNFAHVIEGKEAVVKALFGKISRDSRHHGIHLLWSKPIDARDFPDYSMGFRRTDPESFKDQLPEDLKRVFNGEALKPERLDELSKQVATLLRTFSRNTHLID